MPGTEVMPYTLTGIHMERRCPFLTARGEIPAFVAMPSYGLMSQTGQEFLNGNASYHLYIHRRLIDDETDSKPELCRELSQRTAP